MIPSIKGIFGPVITTFDRRGELDLDAFGANLKAHIAAGLDGVLVAGSTGEAALLEESERLRLVEMARSVIPASRQLLVGTGAESTKACVRRCREAAERGANACLVVAPHYYSNAMSTAALQAHYERVADESPVPILLYNIPKYMHFRLEPELVARLAEHDNIIGMKDSSGDLETMAKYLLAQTPHFGIVTGHAGSWLKAIHMGVVGGIMAVALFAPELTQEIARLAKAKQEPEASEAQRRLTPLGMEIVGRMGIPAVKVAMQRVGLHGGPVRLPLLDLSPSDAALVAELLRESSVASVA
ncbi:MAG TPA: dihydrodipicolinate synthase family protein [Gemmatimonadaceae bacterium]|nr:dihydrodipicolinate synthase family protein [Gemmatimonadaceae bacterium]